MRPVQLVRAEYEDIKKGKLEIYLLPIIALIINIGINLFSSHIYQEPQLKLFYSSNKMDL